MCQVAVLASWLEIIRKIGWAVGMEDFLGEKVPDRGHDRNGLGEKIFMRRLGDKPFCLSLASESHGAIGWVVPNGLRYEKWTDALFRTGSTALISPSTSGVRKSQARLCEPDLPERSVPAYDSLDLKSHR